MKKFALAAVAAAAMAGGVAHAYTVGTYSDGFVVPSVELTANGTTAVGIINRTNSVVPVFWVFHDQNSGHVLDGCFPMTANQYKGVAWGSDLGDASVAGLKGYLVFAAGINTSGTAADAAAVCNAGSVGTNTAALLSANAFQVDTASSDVAVVPVIDGPLTLAAAPLNNLKDLSERSLVSIAGAAQVTPGTGPVITARYAKGVAGAKTVVNVWSTGDHSGRHTVDIYNSQQQRTSTNFVLTKAELDLFDPSTMVGTTAFTDGFIEWNAGKVPANFKSVNGESALGTTSGSVFVYSTISLPACGAVQTLLGATQ